MKPLQINPKLQDVLGWLLLTGSVMVILFFLFWPRDSINYPIFDVQLHYHRDAWRYFTPRAVINTMKQLQITRAAVSSTPNDGTFKLLQEGGLHVIPMFQPYRTREDRDNWFENPEILAWMEKEIRNWDYKGIGEFHLFEGQMNTPVVRRLVELAAQYNLLLLAHTDSVGIDQLYRMNSELRIIWAHAGMLARPHTIGAMLDGHPNLWAELSHRTDVAPDGRLDPEWKALFLRHPDRFMLGSGTYNNEYWYQYRYMVKHVRAWLDQLPPETAEAIAHKNAARVFAVP